MDSSQNTIQMSTRSASESPNQSLQSSLFQLLENLYLQLESSGTDQDLLDMLNDAMPDSLSCWVESIIKNELETAISNEMDNAGLITPQTWRIIAHNIFKNLKDSPQMSVISKHIETFLNNSLQSFTLSDKLGCNAASLTQPKQIKQIAKDLNTDRPLSTKLQELQMLLHSQLPHLTLVQHECWPQICQYMCEIFCEDSGELCIVTLKIHAKLISSTSSLVIKEGFVNLVNGISSLYSQKLLQLPNSQEGFNLLNPIHKRLAQMTHQVLFTLKKLSIVVVKVNGHFEEMLTSFIKLLSVKTFATLTITPYVTISALDPEALWFKRLLHSVNVRNLVISMLTKSTLLQSIVKQILSFEICDSKMNFASMNHSINMFCSIVQYKSGQSLFPLTVMSGEEPITLEDIYVSVVTYLNATDNDEIVKHVLKASIPVPVLSTGILRGDSPLMRALLEPLPNVVPKHTADALEKIVETYDGVASILKAHDAKTLVDFTGMALENHIQCKDDVKLSLIRTCGKLFEHHNGFYKLENSPLIPKIVIQYKILASSDANTILHNVLYQFLLCVGSTPLGLLMLTQYENLLDHLLKCNRLETANFSRFQTMSAILVENQRHDFPNIGSYKNFELNVEDHTVHQNIDLGNFLQIAKDTPHDENWRSQLKKIYKDSTRQNVTVQMLYDLVEQLSQHKKSTPLVLSQQETTTGAHVIQAVNWIICYGEHNNLLQHGGQKYTNELIELHSLFHKNYEDSFDWFLGLSFLICSGNVERCCHFLKKVSSFPVACILWPNVYKSQSQRTMFAFGHKLELIIEEELPLAARVLKMSSICWWIKCRHWIAQSFVNILKWNQICHWLALVLINQSEDSCIYFCVSLLKYLEPKILVAHNNGNIVDYLNQPIDGFHINDFITFMSKMTKCYQNLKL